MRFIILGGYEPYIIEAKDWEDAMWKAWDYLKDCLAAIILIPEEQK